jgi:hypothetical protein
MVAMTLDYKTFHRGYFKASKVTQMTLMFNLLLKIPIYPPPNQLLFFLSPSAWEPGRFQRQLLINS